DCYSRTPRLLLFLSRSFAALCRCDRRRWRERVLVDSQAGRFETPEILDSSRTPCECWQCGHWLHCHFCFGSGREHFSLIWTRLGLSRSLQVTPLSRASLPVAAWLSRAWEGAPELFR